MTPICDDLAAQMSLDFSQACLELAQARHLLREKDSTAHRSAVADLQARIDLILDVFLQLTSDSSQRDLAGTSARRPTP